LRTGPSDCATKGFVRLIFLGIHGHHFITKVINCQILWLFAVLIPKL
jgi:hypothetical protein